MTIKEIRKSLGLTQRQFAKTYKIPLRTIQNWEANVRIPPIYVLELLEEKAINDIKKMSNCLFNKKASMKLPNKYNYLGAQAWLHAITEIIGNDVVFALDEALMCEGLFQGHMVEDYIYVYGDEALTKYKGVIVLKDPLNQIDIKEINGIKYTNLNRTINDYFEHETIVDEQGIIEGLSKYYYKNNESFYGLFISPNFNEKFERISKDAIEYYNS